MRRPSLSGTASARPQADLRWAGSRVAFPRVCESSALQRWALFGCGACVGRDPACFGSSKAGPGLDSLTSSGLMRGGEFLFMRTRVKLQAG